MSKSDLESSVESHQALAEQWPSKSVECLASARWDSTGDSKSLSPVERSVAAAECSVGLVVYKRQDNNITFKTFSSMEDSWTIECNTIALI